MTTSDSQPIRDFKDHDRVMEFVDTGFEYWRILVVGDVMLDRHGWGSVNRISPEAPVPIVRFLKERQVAGGSGNVAMNLVGLGMRVSLVALTGTDEAADQLRAVLGGAGVDVEGLVQDSSRPTTTKMRVIGGHQQMLRLDFESSHEPSAELQDRLLEEVRSKLDSCSAVILSDYAKGLLTPELCQRLIALSRQRQIPVLVDPKGSNWEKYRGATLITPNRTELAAVCSADLSDPKNLVLEAQRLRRHLGLDAMTVTLSEEGMIHVDEFSAIRVPAMAREVFDVSGAGDTAIATLTGALVTGLSDSDSLVLANVAAGIVVGKVGTVPLARSELLNEIDSLPGGDGRTHRKITKRQRIGRTVEAWRARGERVVFTNGCFDILHAGHVSYLSKARELGDRLVIGLNTDASVQRLKGAGRPINAQSHRALVLASLEAVDSVVLFDEDTPLELIRELKPDVLAKGADYTVESIVGAEDVLSWGGEVKLLDLMDGLSTTRIVSRLASLER